MIGDDDPGYWKFSNTRRWCQDPALISDRKVKLFGKKIS